MQYSFKNKQHNKGKAITYKIDKNNCYVVQFRTIDTRGLTTVTSYNKTTTVGRAMFMDYYNITNLPRAFKFFNTCGNKQCINLSHIAFKNGHHQVIYRINKNNCWIVTSHLPDTEGYAKIRTKDGRMKLHRYVYMKHHSLHNLSSDIIIRHECDTRLCINPDHLLSGSIQDNIDDRNNRNRTAKGSRCGSSKLTENQVLKIKNDKIHSNKELSILHNIGLRQIYYIKKNQQWSWLDQKEVI